MSLGNYIREKGFTNKSLAKKAMVSEATLSQILNNKREMKVSTACKLSKALGITVDELIKMV